MKCPLPIPEEFLKSAFMFKFVVQFRKQVGPSNWGRGAVLSWLYSASSCMCLYRLSNPSRPSLLSVGRKPHPCHFPECSHTVPTRTGLHSDITGCSVFSGSLAYRVVHVLAYHSELRGGLPIKFRGLNTVPIPTHVSLLLEKLCSWHLNHGVQQLISDVFLNRIMSQNPSFSSCKHMSHLTPLKPYQIQTAREQRITYSRP